MVAAACATENVPTPVVAFVSSFPAIARVDGLPPVSSTSAQLPIGLPYVGIVATGGSPGPVAAYYLLATDSIILERYDANLVRIRRVPNLPTLLPGAAAILPATRLLATRDGSAILVNAVVPGVPGTATRSAVLVFDGATLALRGVLDSLFMLTVASGGGATEVYTARTDGVSFVHPFLMVLNATTLTITDSAATPALTSFVAPSPVAGRWYVATLDGIGLFDAGSQSIVASATLPFIATISAFGEVVLDEAGGRVIVGDPGGASQEGSGTVRILDATTLQTLGTLQLPSTDPRSVRRLAWSSAQGRLFVLTAPPPNLSSGPGALHIADQAGMLEGTFSPVASPLWLAVP